MVTKVNGLEQALSIHIIVINHNFTKIYIILHHHTVHCFLNIYNISNKAKYIYKLWVV